jgi:hypothetical protein
MPQGGVEYWSRLLANISLCGGGPRRRKTTIPNGIGDFDITLSRGREPKEVIVRLVTAFSRLRRPMSAALVAAAIALPLVPAPASAHDWEEEHEGWHHGHGWYKHHRDYVVVEEAPAVIYAPPPPPRVVYVEPPPRVVYVEPEPVYVAPPPRVVYRQAPAAYQPAPTYACSGVGRDTIGALVGGVGGGVLGSHIGRGTGRTVSTIASTLGGALLGNSVGRSLDHAEGC